jgi:hypothetical protein
MTMIRRLGAICLFAWFGLAVGLLPAYLGLLSAGCKKKPAQPPVDPKKLVILKATWAAVGEGPQADVTKTLASMVEDNVLSVRVTPQVLGDPAPFQVKSLTVEYEKGGVFARKHAEENQTLTIPLEERPKPIRVVVRRALYGSLANNKVVDVTRQVSDLVNGDGLTVTPTNSLFGDPASFELKQLQVDYEFDHQPKTKTVAEKQTLVISAESP